MSDKNSVEYINSTDYKTLEDKINELEDVLNDLRDKSYTSRKLRYADVDIEAERLAGRIAPDELYIPQHIIDTNIRREQSPYVQFITQSPRAVCCTDNLDRSIDLSVLEADLTEKLRYDGWQLAQFANIDGFQANGYGIMEVINDKATQGGVSHESVQYGDFGFISDTRDIQAVEFTSRSYYFTKTRLLELCGNPKSPKPDSDWDKDQVEKVITQEPSATNQAWDNEDSIGKRSLYRIQKMMFRIQGIVHVAWCNKTFCDDWLRKPRPLYIGRRKINPAYEQWQQQEQKRQQMVQMIQSVRPQVAGATQSANTSLPGYGNTPPSVPPELSQPQPAPPTSTEAYETDFPYILFPYLISENDTIAHLKGRVFLDQDLQEGVTSLLSATVTQSRRAAGLYFSKDTDDPNDDILMQKNIHFKSGSLINSKVKAFNINPPDPSTFSAIQMLIAGNQNETSQVNFAVQNRKDSRKTAKEIEVATDQATVLSTVQVVLFSMALCKLYQTMCDVIKSRVIFGLIQVQPSIAQLYQRTYTVKPSGDTDVIEKQKLIQTMMQAWPVVSQTAAAQAFLMDLIELMFPMNAPKYLKAFQQAAMQAQSQQAQQQNMMMQMLQGLGQEVINLDSHREYFSETGLINVYPKIEDAAKQVKLLEKQLQRNQGHGGAGANGKPQPQMAQ